MKLPWVSRASLEEAEARFLALQQDLQAYRRRMNAQQKSAGEAGKAEAVQAFLPVYDNLLRALEQPCSDEAFVTGIRMTQRILHQALEALEITEIPALGETFDARWHEALDHVEDSAVGENQIVRVVQVGFRQGDAVLRPALVIVAN